MSIDPTSDLKEESMLQQSVQTPMAEALVIQVDPEDEFEHILLALRLQDQPVILLLPEHSQAFSDPAHFEQLRQVITPDNVCFVLPQRRLSVLGKQAHRQGFSFASSLEKAEQLLALKHQQHIQGENELQTPRPSRQQPATRAFPQAARETIEHELEEQDAPAFDEQDIAAPGWSPPRSTPLPASPPVISHKKAAKRRLGLIAAMLTLIVVAGAVLLPALFSMQPGLQPTTGAPTTTVGQITFTSSGQVDPSSSKGLNDIVTVSLNDLSTPATGQSYYAWLMPDKTDDTTPPLLLGRLAITGGKAKIIYTHPDHANLLASYSGFEVTEEPGNQIPTTPSLDPKALRYEGSIPDIPTPGDEQHYSLLSHVRHLLAKDPTLQQIGLQGGLDIWLYRNAGKILEWASAARDSWAGGHQTDLIHRHMIRILDDLDGVAYVYTSGDLPAGSPVLVDPTAGRIGLLELNQTQALPGYLTHVDIHLLGLVNSPGHTQAQQVLATKIDKALKMDTTLFQHIRQDAIKLVKMNTTQLQSNEALSLLDTMVSEANEAYTGQFDSATGGTINGIVWIHHELQGIATEPITIPTRE
jgi:hypothetical protein